MFVIPYKIIERSLLLPHSNPSCAHEKKIISFIHQVLSLWILGFALECLVWAKLSKMFRCDLEYLSPSRLYFLEAEAASMFCYITSISATHCLTQAISTLGWAVSMEWQSVDRKLRKFKMWNIDQSRGQSQGRPSSVTCWLESQEETKQWNKETFFLNFKN